MKQRSNEPDLIIWWNRISNHFLIRFLLLFASGWALLLIFQYFEDIVFTFTIASIAAFLLNYPVRYLERFLGRGLALGIVIFLSLSTIIGGGIIIGLKVLEQFQQLLNLISQNLSTSNVPVNRIETFLAGRRINIDLEPIANYLKTYVESGINIVLGTFSSLPHVFLSFIIIIVVTCFMLVDGEKIWQLALKVLPASRREEFSMALKKSFVGFFRGQVLISLLLGLSSFVSFAVLQIPFALALSVIVALLDTIPGIGATLGVITISFIVLIQSGWLPALKVLIASIILQQVQDNFVAPKIMQSTVNLNPVIVFFALMVGARIAGILGVFLSVPIAGLIVNLLEVEEMKSRS